MQADSDEEFSDEDDDYASVHINEIEQNQVTQAATIEAQKKLSAEINQNSDNEEGEDDGEEDGDDLKSKSMNQTGQDKAFRDSKKMEETNNERFYIPFEDRVMRTRERYLVSTLKHPGYQIEDIGKTSNQKTEILTEMLRKKCLNHVRQSVITYITILVYHREIADKMRRERVFKKTDFAWQLSFKFDILNIPDVIDKLHEFEGQQIDMDSEKVQSKIMTKLVEVEFDVLQYKKDYGFEYIGNQ